MTLSLDHRFEAALDSLWMTFQPIFPTGAGTVWAYEALMRSREPALHRHGALVEAADRLGRGHQLGRVVRRQVARSLASFPEDVLIFVNLEPVDLEDPELLWGNDPLAPHAGRIVHQVTERAAPAGIRSLAALRERGFSLALDHFSIDRSGPCSLAQLKPDYLKLDQALVCGIEVDPVRRGGVDRVFLSSADCGCRVIADRVETIAELRTVTEMGCDFVQGPLLGWPMPRPMPEGFRMRRSFSEVSGEVRSW